MSYNPNFYNNFSGNNFTFQLPVNIPPPPRPPPFFIPPRPIVPLEISDKEFIKNFETKLHPEVPKIKKSSISINGIRRKISFLFVALNDLKKKQKYITDLKETLSEKEWEVSLREIKENKKKIDKILSEINDRHLSALRVLLARRSAKRLRLKRLKADRKQEKEHRLKDLAERSRKIDENLQKIKDDIIKARKEEEAKVQADIVLKEVLRKKHDAKKCIIKLDELVRLRKALENTAKGRGETVSQAEADAFKSNIDKLKATWNQKLLIYEKEEADLRMKLIQNSEQSESMSQMSEREVQSNLMEWRRVLFGVDMPQVDFHGDVNKFVAIRSEWDHYLNDEGSTLPVGWVPPANIT